MPEPILDPATLRALADEASASADHLAQCCGGAHERHRWQIATYSTLATDYRTRAIRLENERGRAVQHG